MTDSDPGSDPLLSATKEHAKCEKCGATMRLDTGICVSCLLREGLEGCDEVSPAFYQSVLAEVDAPHKFWFLGNYKILEQIGCGGMGVIYRARQRHSRRIVAVKRVLSYRADSHGALERFRREAQAVASLDHPNILPIYEVSDSEDGLPFFSMKFAEKGSLRENVASLRDEPRKCVQLMAKVVRAVEYAHSRGVLHRDLKPGNILLDDRGEPLVSDFGLAKLLDANNDLTRSLTTFGTAGFIAPEQAGGAAADFTAAADVYSLGAVLFNLLAGRPPFLGSNPVSVIRKASETPAPKLRSLAPSLDRDLETICARCLERNPKARYQSAGDLAADLERWLDGRPIIARPVSPPARIWRWSRRNPKLVGAATTGLVLGAAVVSLFHAEFFRASQINPPNKTVAVLPVSDASETKDQGNKLAVRPSTQEQPGSGTYDFYLERLFTDATHPINSTGISVPLQNPSNPFTVPDDTSPAVFDPQRADTRVTAAPRETGVATSIRDRALGAGPRSNKITAEETAAPAESGVTTGVRDRASEAGPRTNKIKANVTAAPPGTGVATSVRYRASETGLGTNKITADAPASFQGFVKDAKGEPIKGANVRIESRDGKQMFGTVKTDPKGRYISQGLQPGVYRITLLVNGTVKASILNTRTKVDQPTQLNFDFKPTSQAASIAKGGKHMVWVPARTGSHIGGNWVEVDDEGNPHFNSNIQTYNVGH
ncbi:MAG TPA: protein kinase [Candidatus Acidoferrum sp.]|nr:protein kinase [Candidatus Acidoferrum sp.]